MATKQIKSKKEKRPAKKTVSIKRQEHKFDATDIALGRLASQIAALLIGKNRVDYLMHQDMGDKVFVENVKGIKLTGNKLNTKVYQHHTGYPGQIRTKTMKELYENNPSKLLRDCVWNMLPKNKLRKERIKRLVIK